MNLRDLSGEEMVALSAVLLDETGDLLPIMEDNELLVGPSKVIRRAHENLLRVHQQAGTNEKRVKELTAEMTELDALHDRKARGIYRVLEAQADLADSPEEARSLAGLLETLFPKGLTITQRSYREQAGTSKRVQERLSDEDRQRLEGITTGTGTLWQEVELWLETAQVIGRLEAERAVLRRDDSDDSVSASEVRHARIQWIQAVNTMIQMLPFTDLDEVKQRTLLANLQDADERATRARRRAQARVTDTEEPATPVEPSADSSDSEPADVVINQDDEAPQEPTVAEDMEDEVVEPA